MLSYSANLIDKDNLSSFVNKFGLEHEWRQALALSDSTS